MLFLVISLLIASCQPSETDIHKAIAETQTAQLPITFTPTPRIFLRDYLITIEDLTNFGQYYKPAPFINDDPYSEPFDFVLKGVRAFF